MKNSTRFFIGFSLLILFCCYGCGVENSEAEKRLAQQAMDNARSFHAEELAAESWKEAMQAWDQGEAAVKEGKPSKTLFLRAKSRFEKVAKIAQAQQDDLAKDVSDLQVQISERYARVQTALESGRLSSRDQNQIKPLVAEVASGTETVTGLVSQGEYLKARTTAREILKKAYNAELIMAGQKPAP